MTNSLQTLRKASNLSKELLAQFLGVSVSHVNELEKGSTQFTTTQLERLCALFDCSEEEMLGEETLEVIPMNLKGKSLEELNAIARVCR